MVSQNFFNSFAPLLTLLLKSSIDNLSNILLELNNSAIVLPDFKSIVSWTGVINIVNFLSSFPFLVS